MPTSGDSEDATPEVVNDGLAVEKILMPFDGVEIEFKLNELGTTNQQIAVREFARFKALTGISIVPDFTEYWQWCGQTCSPVATPDIWYGRSGEIPGLAARGHLLELDGYIESWSEWADFYPVAKRAVTYGGQVLGIPISTNYRGSIVIRPSLFEAAGIPPEPPHTWEELNVVAPKLTVREGEEFVQAGFNLQHSTGEYEDWLLQAGGSPFSSDLKRPRNDSEEGRTALMQHVRHGLTDKTMPVEGMDTSQLGPPFCVGRVAIQQLWPGNIKHCELRAPHVYSDLAVGPPLQGPRQRAMNIYVSMYVASKETKHPDAAFETLKYFAAPGPNLEINFPNFTRMPTRSAMEDYELYSLDPYRTLVANLRFAETRQVNRHHYDIQWTMDRWVEEAALGEVSISESLRNMDAQIEEILQA